MNRRRWAALAIIALGFVWFCTRLDSSLVSKRASHLLVDRRGAYLGEVPGSDDGFGYWPLPDTLPEKIVVTTLETEDRHFHEHAGVYAPSVFRALWQDLKNRRVVSGASTIAMQVARLQHPKDRTVGSKLREAAEAMLLVHAHGHDRVLRQYLTLAPYGNRTHGIVRAARLYFDKPVEDLSWLQAAFLAALPQQPGRMSPWTKEGRERALKRARRILTALHGRKVIDDDALEIALKSDLELVARPKREPEAMHAVLALSKELARPSTPLGLNGTFIHHATIDLEIQHLAAQAVADNVEHTRALGVGNGSALVVDLETAEVLAYVGSADYFDAEHHGALDYVQTRRSPGSALKPFIYAMAIDRGTHTAATEIADTPAEFVVPGGGLYVPENISHTFLGPMLLREALGNSRNIPAMRVLSDVGVEPAVAMFEHGGVGHVAYTPDAYGLTLAIGSLHVTALELGTLYTALAHQGVTTPLKLFATAPSKPGARLFNADSAELVRHILADPDARRPSFPPGSPLDFDFAVAIKTGTSQGYRDAWAAALSDRLLVITWVGNHDWRRMNLASGVTAAAPPAHRIMAAVMPLRDVSKPIALSFPPPATATVRDVCALSGKLPGPGCTHLKTEFFVRGTEPTEACPYHVDVRVDLRNGLLAGPTCKEEFVSTRPMLALPESYGTWARRQHLSVAPTAESPLCPTHEVGAPRVSIREPRPASRYLYDPDTPREFSTVRLAAAVEPATEEVVWIVDGTPVAKVGYPHELRWPMTPGAHTIRAQLARSPTQSSPVVIVVDD